MRKQAEKEEVTQRVDENLLINLKQFPSQVKNFFTTNIINRAFSYLVGFTERGVAVMLRATEAGVLKVANVGSGLSQVYTDYGTAEASVSGAIALTDVVSQVELNSYDYGFYFYPSPDGAVFYDEIYVPAGETRKYDLTVHSYKVARSGANDAEYGVVGLK